MTVRAREQAVRGHERHSQQEASLSHPAGHGRSCETSRMRTESILRTPAFRSEARLGRASLRPLAPESGGLSGGVFVERRFDLRYLLGLGLLELGRVVRAELGRAAEAAHVELGQVDLAATVP